MAMMMMERPKAKPRNRKSKNKTVSIPEVNDDFSSFESQAQPLEDILTLEFHVDEDHADLPGSPGHCFASKVNEDHEDEDHEDKDHEDEVCQCENDQPKPRRKYKQAVTSSGQTMQDAWHPSSWASQAQATSNCNLMENNQHYSISTGFASQSDAEMALSTTGKCVLLIV